MDRIVTIYHKVVPIAVRSRLYEIRTAPRKPEFRGRLADWRCALHRSIARVRINDMDLYVNLLDRGVGRPLFTEMRYEPAETDFFRTILKPGDVFFDIGANIGYYTMLASRLVGNSGHVVSIEPDPDNFRLLARSDRRNRPGNTTLLNFALGASKVTAKLYRSDVNKGDHRMYFTPEEPSRESVNVDVVTFDSVVDQVQLRPTCIKMDIQGFEPEVVQGMQRTLEKPGPLTVMTEFWPYGIERSGNSAKDFLDIFQRSGFRAALLRDDGGTRNVPYPEIMDHMPAYETITGPFMNIIFYK